jgi:hypothetical protein
VLAVPDRQDALELADDLFVGLAEPQVKFMHRHLNHLVEDIRSQSITDTKGQSESTGQSRTHSDSASQTQGQSAGISHGLSRALQQGNNRSRTYSRGKTWQSSETDSESDSSHESHSTGFSETDSRQRNSQNNSSETVHEHKSSEWFSEVSSDRSKTKGSSSGESRSHSRTDTGSDSYESSHSSSHSSSKSKGGSTSLAWQRGRQSSLTLGRSVQRSSGTNESATTSQSETRGQSSQQGSSSSHSVTDQPGTRHTAFWEEDPEHWKLEEQRWRASELLMTQQTGNWFIRTSHQAGFGSNGLPEPFYTLPGVMLRLTGEISQHLTLTAEQADEATRKRQQSVLKQLGLTDLPGSQKQAADETPFAEPPPTTKSQSIWNRSSLNFRAAGQRSAKERRRGPKTDFENHAKVAAIVQGFGAAWQQEEPLLELCQQLDEAGVPVPRSWPTRGDVRAHTWQRALLNNRSRVIQAIKDHLKAAQRGSAPADFG